MKQTICFNCKEKLEPDDQKIKVRQRGKVREWCDACRDGFLLTKEENSDKLNNNQLANEIPDFTAS